MIIFQMKQRLTLQKFETLRRSSHKLPDGKYGYWMAQGTYSNHPDHSKLRLAEAKAELDIKNKDILSKKKKLNN